MNMRREVPISKASRMYTGDPGTPPRPGPHVQGCRPVLVTFESFKDREDVLSKARLLKRSNIYVSEDLSRYF